MNTKVNEKVFETFPVLESMRLFFRAFNPKDASGHFLG
jgi:hypothetical protein